MKTLQINMVAAMVMGNVITNASGSLDRSLCGDSREVGDALCTQRDTGHNRYNMLCKKEMVAEYEPEDVRSWISKICKDFGCDRSEIVVYHIWTEGCTSGNELLSLKHTLSGIAQLAQLRCNAAFLGTEVFLSPEAFLRTEAFTKITNSLSAQSNWQHSLLQRGGETCYIVKDDATQADQHTLLHRIPQITGLPLVLISIYEGNLLDRYPGGFKDYFSQADVYNGTTRTQFKAGFFFDENVQDKLASLFPYLQRGLTWFFVIFKEEIYMMHIK